MKMKWMLVMMLTALLLAAAPLAADDAAQTPESKQEIYRKAILEHAKLDINVFKEQLKGGRADGRAITDFPLQQLIAGIETEMEHTDNPMLALEIAMDHLVQRPHYYSHLAVMLSGHNRGGMHQTGIMKKKGSDCAAKKGAAAAGDGHKYPGNAEAGDGHKCSGNAQAGDGHKCPGSAQAGDGHKCPGNAQAGEGHKCSPDCPMKSETGGKTQECAAAKKAKKSE